MHQILWLLYIAIIWYKKSTSLPKLYPMLIQTSEVNRKTKPVTAEASKTFVQEQIHNIRVT